MVNTLGSLGWDNHWAARYARMRSSESMPGRVSKLSRGICSVLTQDGLVRASLDGGLLALGSSDLRQLPAVGDWVMVRRWPDERLTVSRVLRRRNLLLPQGMDDERSARVIAANLDAVVSVVTADQVPDNLFGQIIARNMDIPTIEVRLPQGLAEGRREVEEAVRGLTGRGKTVGLAWSGRGCRADPVRGLLGVSTLRPRSVRHERGVADTCLIPLPGEGTVLDLPGVLIPPGVRGTGHIPGSVRVIEGKKRRTPSLLLAPGVLWAPDQIATGS
jgi:ribosome biogenesis GTPase / thiamine phosphate phosphatase